MGIKFSNKPERPEGNGEGKDVRNGKGKKTNVKGGKAKASKNVNVKGTSKQKKI